MEETRRRPLWLARKYDPPETRYAKDQGRGTATPAQPSTLQYRLSPFSSLFERRFFGGGARSQHHHYLIGDLEAPYHQAASVAATPALPPLPPDLGWRELEGDRSAHAWFGVITMNKIPGSHEINCWNVVHLLVSINCLACLGLWFSAQGVFRLVCVRLIHVCPSPIWVAFHAHRSSGRVGMTGGGYDIRSLADHRTPL